jgi:hypothetical protein
VKWWRLAHLAGSALASAVDGIAFRQFAPVLGLDGAQLGGIGIIFGGFVTLVLGLLSYKSGQRSLKALPLAMGDDANAGWFAALAAKDAEIARLRREIASQHRRAKRRAR